MFLELTTFSEIIFFCADLTFDVKDSMWSRFQKSNKTPYEKQVSEILETPPSEYVSNAILCTQKNKHGDYFSDLIVRCRRKSGNIFFYCAFPRTKLFYLCYFDKSLDQKARDPISRTCWTSDNDAPKEIAEDCKKKQHAKLWITLSLELTFVAKELTFVLTGILSDFTLNLFE